MPLIYITGISGSGKSAVRGELLRRGYEAYGTDEDGVAFFYNNDTNEPITARIPPEERTPEWRRRYTWKASREKVEALAAKARNETIFLCGVTSNDSTELWDLFDRVIALNIDEPTLTYRITNRTSSNFGKNTHEFARLLEWQQTAKEDYSKLGAIIIDATKPLEKVVDQILLLAKN